ncbi:MAG: FmdB family zinc ribbon protein [Burkholderiaceae bacterium]
MPIYAYRCTECGHAKDVLQKMSDPVLTECPACGAQAFSKQVTAAGFQLKGSGWYVTDFRGDGKPPKAAEDGAKSATSEPAKADTSTATPAATKTETAAASASAPSAPSPAPAAPAAGAK